MSVFVKGYLSKAEQAEIRRKENEILAGPGSDVSKAAQIEFLYRQRGLEPGSFRQPGYGEDSAGENEGSGSLRWLWLQLYICIIAFLFFAMWGAFARRFPDLADVMFKVFLEFWNGLGYMLFDFIPHMLEWMLTKL